VYPGAGRVGPARPAHAIPVGYLVVYIWPGCPYSGCRPDPATRARRRSRRLRTAHTAAIRRGFPLGGFWPLLLVGVRCLGTQFRDPSALLLTRPKCHLRETLLPRRRLSGQGPQGPLVLRETEALRAPAGL